MERLSQNDNFCQHHNNYCHASNQASPQTNENRTERISPQSRGERGDEISFFFAAERPAKKNAHALRAGLDRGKRFSSAISAPLAKRAVSNREVYSRNSKT